MEVSSQGQRTHVGTELWGCLDELGVAVERVLVSEEDVFEEKALPAGPP